MDSQRVAKLVREANRSEISRQTGIHISHVSRILSGKRSASSKNLAQLSKELGCSMEDLYTYLTSLRKRSARRTTPATAA